MKPFNSGPGAMVESIQFDDHGVIANKSAFLIILTPNG